MAEITRGRVMHRCSRNLFLVLIFLANLASAQVPKLPMTHDVYDKWVTIRQTAISNDGKWLAYSFAPAVGDGTAIIKNLETGESQTIERASALRFTESSGFLIATITPAKAEVDKAKAEKRKPEDQPKNALLILNLSTLQKTSIERVRSYRVPDQGNWFSYQLEPTPTTTKPADTEKSEQSKKKKNHSLGSELILRNLDTGKEIKLSDVADHTWSKKGVLSYVVSAKEGKGDGIYIFSPADQHKVTVSEGIANYRSLTIDDQGEQVAFLSDIETYQNETPEYKPRIWSQSRGVTTFDIKEILPENWQLAERGGLSFSKSGKRLFFAVAPRAVPEPPANPDEEKAVLDVWNWRDPLLQPMQLVQATTERNRSFSAMLDKTGKAILLETPDRPRATVGNERDGNYAIVQTSLPYQKEISWDGTYSDVYIRDLSNNSETLLLKRYGGSVGFSPTGRYAFWYQAGIGWSIYDCETKTRRVVSAGAPTTFEDEKHDTPNEPSSYGVAGWTSSDNEFWVYDRFDIWSLDPKGTRPPTKITNGRSRNIRSRVLRMETETRWLDPSKIILTTFDESTKDSGFAKLDGKQLLAGPKSYTFTAKAKNADVVIITRRSFDEFPDLWLTNSAFTDPVKQSSLGDQMNDYLWGTSELLEWTSADGQSIQGVLIKPGNFDRMKKYPMIVYFYEELSDNLHNFVHPAPGSSSINLSFYASRGYLILLPDIPYKIGYPGESAMSAIIPGVHAVAAKGYLDTNKVGIQGHSWGGYQVLYLVTHSNMFAAAEAGAPVANMFSAYGGIRWQTGMSRQFQYEKTQSRIGGTMWEKPLQFLQNSPIFWVDKVTTPTLILHNDKDGAVPWYQGIEFFTAMRRLDKPCWLINYNDEGHGIAKRANQKDWAIRMQQFFDHYLMGSPAPKWMTDGVPAINKGKELGLGVGG